MLRNLPVRCLSALRIDLDPSAAGRTGSDHCGDKANAKQAVVRNMRNTGQRPIEDPVITDFLPSDANGAMLVFVPGETTQYTLQVAGGMAPWVARRKFDVWAQSMPTGSTSMVSSPSTATLPGAVGPPARPGFVRSIR